MSTTIYDNFYTYLKSNRKKTASKPNVSYFSSFYIHAGSNILQFNSKRFKVTTWPSGPGEGVNLSGQHPLSVDTQPQPAKEMTMFRYDLISLCLGYCSIFLVLEEPPQISGGSWDPS